VAEALRSARDDTKTNPSLSKVVPTQTVEKGTNSSTEINISTKENLGFFKADNKQACLPKKHENIAYTISKEALKKLH